MEGWISLYRKFLDWEWYEDNNAKSLFIHCLLKANNKQKEWRGIVIKRGQFFTSIKSLSDELKLSDKQIRIALSKLKKTQEIQTVGASNGTMITICKYDSYQGNITLRGRTKGRTRGERGATTNKDNKIISISLDFYQNQIASLNGEKYSKEYQMVFDYISGKNDLERPLDEILQFPDQLTYKQFEKLFEKSKKKEFSFKETLMTITNKKDYWDKKTSLYLTLNGWVNRSKDKK